MRRGGMTTPIDMGMTDERRQDVVLLLNALLADEYLLYTKTRNYTGTRWVPSSTTCISSLSGNITS
jgi:hypothetical protein